MRQDLWRAILGARGDVARLVAAAVGDYPSQPPARAATTRPAPRVASGPRLLRVNGGAALAADAAPGAPRLATAQDTARLWIDPAQLAPVASAEHDTMRRLHQDVHARVELLRGALTPEPGGEQAMLALVLYFDEYVMSLVPDFLATSWPLLQTRLTGRKTGGSDFFRLIDRLLETESQPALVLEVYFFCLSSGFQGQYADDLATLERYQQHLRARIVAPEPQRQAPEPQRQASPAALRHPISYYLVALAVVFFAAVLLTVWSNQ